MSNKYDSREPSFLRPAISSTVPLSKVKNAASLERTRKQPAAEDVAPSGKPDHSEHGSSSAQFQSSSSANGNRRRGDSKRPEHIIIINDREISDGKNNDRKDNDRKDNHRGTSHDSAKRGTSPRSGQDHEVASLGNGGSHAIQNGSQNGSVKEIPRNASKPPDLNPGSRPADAASRRPQEMEIDAWKKKYPLAAAVARLIRTKSEFKPDRERAMRVAERLKTLGVTTPEQVNDLAKTASLRAALRHMASSILGYGMGFALGGGVAIELQKEKTNPNWTFFWSNVALGLGGEYAQSVGKYGALGAQYVMPVNLTPQDKEYHMRDKANDASWVSFSAFHAMADGMLPLDDPLLIPSVRVGTGLAAITVTSMAQAAIRVAGDVDHEWLDVDNPGATPAANRLPDSKRRDGIYETKSERLDYAVNALQQSSLRATRGYIRDARRGMVAAGLWPGARAIVGAGARMVAAAGLQCGRIFGAHFPDEKRGGNILADVLLGTCWGLVLRTKDKLQDNVVGRFIFNPATVAPPVNTVSGGLPVTNGHNSGVPEKLRTAPATDDASRRSGQKTTRVVVEKPKPPAAWSASDDNTSDSRHGTMRHTSRRADSVWEDLGDEEAVYSSRPSYSST